ncbi:transglutaminase family protein [Microbacterium sp. NPDC078428]|uniref:transglutaminase family protein n=1 Tax=Microbacterium sp. NPDC078428 TaxID=3364190 RepID=UPI0037CC794D
MKRDVGARIALTVTEPAELVFSFAVAADAATSAESILFSLDGASVEAEELVDAHGTRLHRVKAGTGSLVASYTATVEGRIPPEDVDPTDLIRYLRPSRYCESDTLGPTAAAEFGGLSGGALLDAVSSWVGTRLAYVSGSSLPTDGAARTLLARQGVCRDYAHLCVALLRARNVPARLVSVYAPGLDPMDFHAVAEAYVEGGWHVVDATTLAPRGTMLRIATGRDASDTAFLTTIAGRIAFDGLEVTAVADALPGDDITKLDRLG